MSRKTNESVPPVFWAGPRKTLRWEANFPIVSRKTNESVPPVFWAGPRKTLRWEANFPVTGAEPAVLGAACRGSGDQSEHFTGGNVVSSQVKWKCTPQMTSCFSTDTPALRFHVRHQRSSQGTRRTRDSSDSRFYSPKRKLRTSPGR